MTPTVSIITPSTVSRATFNERCKQIAQSQDYPNIIEHLFDLSDETVGVKRHKLCQKAKGEIICFADSDDFYAKDWVSRSVNHLLTTQSDLVGLKSCYFHDVHSKASWLYAYRGTQSYAVGATYCMWHTTYERFAVDGRNPFSARNVGEDNYFTSHIMKISNHYYLDGFLALRHGQNTSPISLRPPKLSTLHVASNSLLQNINYFAIFEVLCRK